MNYSPFSELVFKWFNKREDGKRVIKVALEIQNYRSKKQSSQIDINFEKNSI